MGIIPATSTACKAAERNTRIVPPTVLHIVGKKSKVEVHGGKNKVILSDYNTFWESVGGECDSNGYYHIPRTLARKSEADIASKKRAEYRRRYQLLDSIHSQLSSMFRH